MMIYIATNYREKNKNGEFETSSYRYQLIGHNASGFDNVIVMNSLPKDYNNKYMKPIRTSRGFLKINLRVGSVYEDDKEIPNCMKFVCSKVHISGSLKKYRKNTIFSHK